MEQQPAKIAVPPRPSPKRGSARGSAGDSTPTLPGSPAASRLRIQAGPNPSLARRVFDKYDADGSGAIDKKEFVDMCYDLGYYLSRTELEIAIKLVDRDGSGTIDFDEFYKWWTTDERFTKFQLDDKMVDRMQQVSRYFRFFDKDRSGVLDKEEFRRCYADLTKNGMTKRSFDDCFNEIDTDGNGSIEFNEFVEWFNRPRYIKAGIVQC
eukprot:TRINITY_DN2469_c0_g1_i1.p1 TRINITY_DN2469_c0_g1~~TRINITY_DN2469_c0_g1_i1.p1  ORF type:complete len:209 (+),score=43.80 TRINITY_DN2469_c0_g1_i1:44-670(+)